MPCADHQECKCFDLKIGNKLCTTDDNLNIPGI